MSKKLWGSLTLAFGVLVLGGWELDLDIEHIGQPENWICGPTVIAMWAGFVGNISYDPYDIADSCCGENGTTVPEFMDGIYNYTPYGYVFSEWEYSDKQAAVKGIMWTIARYDEPVGIIVEDGGHWILVRGGIADQDPYTYYSESNHISKVYVNDPTEDSPYYSSPITGMYKGEPYDPEILMDTWTKIGAIFDKKYRSVERSCYACWSDQGATFNNNDNFSDY